MNLRQWCERFLDKDCDDTEGIKIAKMVRTEAKKNGYTDDDVSNMYQLINKERKHAKEQDQEAQETITKPTQHNETAKAVNRQPEPHREPKPALRTDRRNADAVRKPQKWKGKSILDMADERGKK